jgi:signal peptidase I
MTIKEDQKNLKGTWNQAILTFLFPILLVFGIRWAIVEPFVIPSGSMIPNLLINDHILVKKFILGLKVPFADHWLVRWGNLKRGDIVVFKFPENPEIYYIKRLIGLPGDKVEVRDGRISVNGEAWNLEAIPGEEGETGFNYFTEQIPGHPHTVRFFVERSENLPVSSYTVPEGHFFFMGDNRDQSSDGRVWGMVKADYLVGKAWAVWLSCENTLPSMSYVCDPSQIRWNRLFKQLQ